MKRFKGGGELNYFQIFISVIIYSYIIFKTILLVYLNEYIKIYMYPNKYNETSLTDFLIKHSKLPVIKKNPEYSSKIKRADNSLCFMLFSDY